MFCMLVEKLVKLLAVPPPTLRGDAAGTPALEVGATRGAIGMPSAFLMAGILKAAVWTHEKVLEVIQYMKTDAGMDIVKGTMPTAIARITFFIVLACSGFDCCCPASPPSSMVIKNEADANRGRP